MTRETLKPGAAVTANHALGYSTTASAPIRYVEPGTRGRVLRIADEKGWSSVEVLFEGHGAIYHCDVPAALFALSGSPTRERVVPGNWASVADGKWHLVVTERPDTRVEQRSLCGVSFRPQNVTWGEAPPTNDRWICKRCVAKREPEPAH